MNTRLYEGCASVEPLFIGKEKGAGKILPLGAGSRGRTDTVLLPSDFESDASANSTIPANGSHIFATLIIISQENQKINSFLKNKIFFYKSVDIVNVL